MCDFITTNTTHFEWVVCSDAIGRTKNAAKVSITKKAFVYRPHTLGATVYMKSSYCVGDALEFDTQKKYDTGKRMCVLL